MSGGKDAATYLKRLFSTLVLEPVVQTAVGSLMGGKTGMAGAGGLGSMGGGLTNWSGWGGTASDWLFDQGVGASMKGFESLGSSMQGLGVTVGRVDAYLKDIPGMSGGIGSAAGYLGSIYSLTQGQYGSAIGSAIGTYIKAFGQTVGYEVATSFASDFGDEATWGGLRIALQGSDVVNWNANRQSRWAPKEFASGEEGYKQYLNAIAMDAKAAFLAMDLPAWADNLLSAATDLDTINAALQQISTIKAVFDGLGQSMAMFSDLSGSVQTTLLNVSGGVDALSSNAQSFYSNYFSEQERLDATVDSLTSTFAKYGAQLPATAEQYRALVEQQMAAGDAGAEFAAVLLGLNGTFKGVADAWKTELDGMSQTVGDFFAGIKDSIASATAEVAGSRQDILRGTGTMTAAEIQAAIGAAMVFAPSLVGVTQAQGATASASSAVAAAKARADATAGTLAWRQGGVNAAQAALGAGQAQKAALQKQAQDLTDWINSLWDGGANSGYSYSKRKRWSDEAAAQLDGVNQQIAAMGPNLDALSQALAQQQAAAGEAGSAAASDAQRLAAAQAALAAAQQAEVQAKAQYAAQMRQFVADASNSVSKLSELRGEVVDFYQAQAQAVQAMLSQIESVRSGVLGAKSSILKPSEINGDALAAQIQGALAIAASSVFAGSTSADQALSSLSELQGDVMAFYQQQKQAVEGMLSSAKSLRETVDSVRMSTLTGAETAREMMTRYGQAYAMALSTTGASRAGYVDTMSKTLPQLAEALKAESATSLDWQLQVGKLLAQASNAAGLLEGDANAATYESKSLTLLGQMEAALAGMSETVAADKGYLSTAMGLLDGIDASLAILNSSTRTAEQVIADAVNNGTASNLAGLRAIVAALQGKAVPAFAAGGLHLGGLRLVGENGPELEATGPSRIWNQRQLASALGGGGNSARVEQLLQQLIEEQRVQASRQVDLQLQLNKQMQRWDAMGMPEVREVSA